MDTVTIMVLSEGTDSQATATRDSGLKYSIEHQRMWYRCPYLTSPGEQEAALGATDSKLYDIMKTVGTAAVTGANVLAGVKAVGRNLFSKLLPASLQQYLKTIAQAHAGGPAPILRIHTNVNWVPWELMYDDDTDFLGVGFQVARLPTSRLFSPTEAPIEEHTVAKVVNLLGNKVLDKNQRDQWATTFADAHVAKEREFRRPGPGSNGDPVDFPSIGTIDTETLRPDILHVTCHGDIPRGNNVTWSLDHTSNDKNSYDIDDMAIPELAASLGFAQQRPLVFGNACASATGPAGIPNRVPTGFAPKFLELGAVAFVGTFAPISKSLAVEFAREFYSRLLINGLPIGEALRDTKKHYRGLKPPEPDPSWLFYSLYGPPELRFTLAP